MRTALIEWTDAKGKRYYRTLTSPNAARAFYQRNLRGAPFAVWIDGELVQEANLKPTGQEKP
jgi:hypothetical protein